MGSAMIHSAKTSQAVIIRFTILMRWGKTFLCLVQHHALSHAYNKMGSAMIHTTPLAGVISFAELHSIFEKLHDFFGDPTLEDEAISLDNDFGEDMTVVLTADGYGRASHHWHPDNRASNQNQ